MKAIKRASHHSGAASSPGPRPGAWAPPRGWRGPLAAIVLVAACVGLGQGCGEETSSGDDAAFVDAPDVVEPVDVAGELTATTACTACAGACKHEAWVYPNAFHESGPIHYKETPPSGGTHDGCWWNWGASATPVPSRNFVHNLEHGGLVLTYDCPDGCAADVAALQKAGEASTRVWLLTPFAGADARIVAMCWSHRLLLDCVDEAAIAAFAQLYCPLAPEQFSGAPAASCMP